MIAASSDEQRRLYELQQVDTAIRQLEHRRTNLPEQKALDENADTLGRVSAEFVSKTERLEELQRLQKRLEDEIATIDARRKSEEGRMYSGAIHNERELEAIRTELGALRGRKMDVEDRLLEIMEEREELESAVGVLRERHQELSQQVEALTAARNEAATEIDAELEARRRERDQARSDVPEDALGAYEDLRSRKDGVAVARLDGVTCEGCHLTLTPIELEEAREQVSRGLARCPQCSRILILDPPAAPG